MPSQEYLKPVFVVLDLLLAHKVTNKNVYPTLCFVAPLLLGEGYSKQIDINSPEPYMLPAQAVLSDYFERTSPKIISLYYDKHHPSPTSLQTGVLPTSRDEG